ncbi:MAG: sporulation initiation factor Spo0A C-terminal domain-containing protein [Candidatus Metalachnospira sp.]|nr:sporulation initiation factor Spo0A C-terminal domain-containing protein [Candidatus Metalachnospira sp.]
MSESADIFTYLSNKRSVLSISVKREINDGSEVDSDTMIQSNQLTPLNHSGEFTQSILRRLGIVPSLNGYTYLTDAINYELTSVETNVSITKCIYPTIAKKHSSSAAKVERSIRHAIEAAWKHTDTKSFEPFFGCRINKKPTNAQFVSAIAEYIKETEPKYIDYIRSIDDN